MSSFSPFENVHTLDIILRFLTPDDAYTYFIVRWLSKSVQSLIPYYNLKEIIRSVKRHGLGIAGRYVDNTQLFDWMLENLGHMSIFSIRYLDVQVAISHGHWQMIFWLLENHPEVLINHRPQLFKSAVHGTRPLSVKQIDFLATKLYSGDQHGPANISNWFGNVLLRRLATECGRRDVFEFTFRETRPAQPLEYNTLMTAVCHRHIDLLDYMASIIPRQIEHRLLKFRTERELWVYVLFKVVESLSGDHTEVLDWILKKNLIPDRKLLDILDCTLPKDNIAAFIRFPDALTRSMLTAAVNAGAVKIVQWLIDVQGQDLFIIDLFQHICTHSASKGHFRLVELAHAHGCPMSVDGHQEATYAVQYDSVKHLQFLEQLFKFTADDRLYFMKRAVDHNSIRILRHYHERRQLIPEVVDYAVKNCPTGAETVYWLLELGYKSSFLLVDSL